MEIKSLLIFTFVCAVLVITIGSGVFGATSNQLTGTSSTDLINLTIIFGVIIIGIILLIYFIRKRDRTEKASKIQETVPLAKEDPTSLQAKDEHEDVIEISKVHNIPYAIEKELNELQAKKAEVEEVIRISKVKFYKRKLDEDSYKEIVKENQERVIRIEAKIAKIKENFEKNKKG